MRTVSRMPCVDALKAIACLFIVLHHLAFYGPMSDVAYPLMSTLIDLFYQYGRMAVQVFFVVAGFLMAAKFAPRGASLVSQPFGAIRQRYMRLIVPYVVALCIAIAGAALARLWLTHDSIPAVPTFTQFAVHLLLLQDLLHQDALSAGVWYVAIDLQLFAVAALLLWLPKEIGLRFTSLRFAGQVLIGLLTLASLLIFNRDASWDNTAFYFFGAYGLGALAYWASRRKNGMLLLALLSGVVVAALLIEFRSRILVAGCTMLLLGLARQTGVLERWQMPDTLTYLGRISYSVFLIHFSVCMLVNAVFFHFFPQQPIANLFGMLIALGASIAAGGLLFKWVENRPRASKKAMPVTANFAVSRLATQTNHR
jgi:peptidoglycan/LPS O-acetylase OafA/YrhL